MMIRVMAQENHDQHFLRGIKNIQKKREIKVDMKKNFLLIIRIHYKNQCLMMNMKIYNFKNSLSIN